MRRDPKKNHSDLKKIKRKQMSGKTQQVSGGIDFVNNPSDSWDRLAEKVSPMELDAIWASKQRQLCDKDLYSIAIKMRFYLKAIYAIFVNNFNFGIFRYRFVAFELPASHFEDWKSMSDAERLEMFGKMRFAPVGDSTQNDNCFVLMFDEKMHLMVGHLDSVFVARHGIQVPQREVVVRQAKPEEALRYALYRISHDENVLSETAKSFAESEKYMKAAEKEEATELLKELEALVKQGRMIEKNITASIKAVEQAKAKTPIPPTVAAAAPASAEREKQSAHDPTTGLTRENLEDLSKFREAALKIAIEHPPTEKSQ